MAIDRTKLQKMHKLMADNGYTQDYNTFEKKFTGDSNYANRKAVYDLFTQNGADLGGSYEEFMRKLQKPRATKPQQQPKTALGRAQQSVAQQKWGGYGGTVTPMQDDSELVRGLKNADAAQRLQAPVSYAKPGAVKQMVKQTRERQHVAGQNVEQAGRQFTNRERDRRNAPAFDLGNEDVNNSLVKTRGQLEDEVEKSANNIVAQSNGIGGMLDNTIGDVFGKVDKEAIDAFRNTQAGGFDDLGSSALANLYKRIDPEKVFKELNTNVEKNISQWLTNPSVISQIDNAINESGISKEAYVNNILVPQIMKRMNEKFDQTELSRNMDKGMAQYYLNGLGSNLTGTLMDILLKTKGTREYEARASAMTEEGLNPDVNPNMADRVIRQTVGFFGDTSVFGPLGKAGAAVTGKIFGNGVAQTARIANSTLGGRIARMAGSGMVSQGVTGVLYGSTNAAVQNYSTGDDTSIGNTVKLMAMGGLSEGASWATMGGIGGAVGAGIYNVSGVKRIPAKAFQLAMEGIGMHMGGNVAKTIEGHDTDWLSVEGNLEACANVVALKLTHARLPKRQEKDGVKESYLDVVARNIKSLMTSDGQRAAFGGYTFTNEEKEQLFGSASAPKRNESIYGYDVHDNPLTRKESLTSWAMRAKKTAAKGKGEKDTDAEFVKTAYDEIMADNTIPWDTKAKFSALVMGTVPSERPMMENCRIEGGSVNEYSKNGELLSKNIFKSIDERNSIIYSLNMKREDQRLSNAYGAAQIKDEKTAQATLEAVAEANGMTAEQLKTAMDKQPLRRSEEEQNACVALRKAYEDEQFVPGTLHAEQSNTEGKDVVEENNLGTENPNNEAVAKVLGDLTKAEDALQAAMDGNDVLKEEYERMQKAGMSNPQIYMELFNSGLTQEQLAPLADYINALSKEQGMFKGTQDKIVETTQKHVGQWSYKGELNGEKQNGEQMVFVKDNKGRVLIVGAGDVAFDNDGRARESVGDMLSVLDPTTMEMDFVSKKDVQLDHVEKTEDYAKNYQTMLEVKNSEVYAQNEQQKQMEKKPENLPKGRKQVVRSLSLLDKVSSPKDKLNEIRRIEQNVELGEKGAITPEEQAHVDEVLAELKEQGYEMDNEGIVGSEFRNNGRNDIIVDNASVIEPGDPRYDKLEDGQTVIDKIIKPKILKDGKIYQPATVTIMFRADTSVSERLYEAKRELAGMLKADESNEIVQRKIAETKAEIAELEKKKAEELASKPQQNPTNAGYEIAKTLKEKIGGSLSEEEATNLVGEMESRAEEAHDMPLTPENWEAEFGEDGKVQTPLGEVKMGKNQLVKLFERGRSKEFGMIKPTLSDPDVVIEVPSEAKDGKAERDTSLLFIKTFKKPNGEKVYYFKSVTIKKDGIEISISSHYDRRKRVEEALKNGKLLYLKQGDAQTEQSQLPVSGTTFREIIAGLNGKDSNNSANGNGNNETLTFADGSPVPMKKDSKNRDTADYSQMTLEQGAEWMASQFGENAEAAVDGQIKRAEKTLKDAEKIKVDYTGDLNDAKEAEAQKKIAIEAAKAELELYTNIKKAMTEKKVKAGMEKVSSVGGVGEVGSVGSVGVAREKFESGLRVVGNKRTRTLADGSKLRGHYEIVDADSLTPSHNANDGYKKSEGFPVNEEGRTINDRDYENDKQAQLVTDMIAMKYDGQAVDQVPVVTSDGIVVDGNGRTMAGQKAAKNGTDSAYLEALKENAENYGFTAEQIEQSGIKHPRLVLVSDEPMKYDTATFAKFNKNEKKAQGNTQQAVANSKKLSTDEIGTIISEIDGSGSLDAFFNNPSAINSLLTRLVDKGVIGLNEVAGLREGEDKLSAAGKDFVKNLLLGSVFSENTIRMMGADAMLKTKALNGIRAVTDNMKLGDYALMKEIDKAVQLLYEARQGGSGVDAYLRTPAMFGENAADRYDPISQAIALALEGKVEDFRELMMAYNRNAAPYADANQTEMFGERPTKEDFVNEFLKLRNWKDYETRHSSKEGNGDAGSSEGTEPQAREGNVITSEADYDKAVEHLKEAKGEERERILDQMGEYVKEFAKSNGYDEPVVLRTKKDLVDAAKTENDKTIIENMSEGAHYPGYYEDGKIHIYLEGSTGSEELRETFEHESVHADNDTDPSRVESLVYSITDMNTLTRRDLESVIEKLVHDTHYTDEARKLPEDEALHMLADEALAHLVEYAQKNGIRAISEITNNPTLLNVAEKAFKERENDRRRKEGLAKSGDKTLERKNLDDVSTEENGRALEGDKEGKPENDNGGSHDRDVQAREEQREVDEDVKDKPSDASLSLSKPLEGRIAETVEKVSKQTGGKVKMVNSVEEIGNEQVRRDIENGKQVTGWYDENTGEVHLYMPNVHDAYTAEKTVWHETVGHKGMRGLLGDKFNDYMRGLWLDLDNPVNAELRAYVKERMAKDSMGFYDAIEEFIAESAEKGKGEPGFWNYIKNKVTDALHEIGYRISPNVKDVKYMLWLAKNVQKKGNDPWWKMRADAVKWKIEHENDFSITEKNGMLYDNNGKKHGLLDLNKKDFDEATDGRVHYRTSPMTASKIEEYNRRLSTKWYAFKESTVDDMQSLQEAMQIISGVKDAYTDIPSAFNPLLCHNRMGSMVMQMCERYDREYTAPLGDAFKKVVSAMPGKDGAEQTRNANLYFIKKHGLERNRVLFVRDWISEERRTKSEESNSIDALEAAWNDERSDLRQKLNSGQIDLREYYRQMDEWIVQNLDKDFKAEEHDYSGMHGIYDVKKGEEYDDANVIDEVMSTESQLGADLVKSFWNAKKKATDFTIDQEYANGFMDKNGRDHLKEMFDWYVPLRKFDDTVAEDVYGYISGGDTKNYIGSVIEKASGRESLSDVNVLAQISALAKSSIINGGKNVEKQHFMRFVEAYEKGDAKDRIFVEIKPWVEKHTVDGNEVWEEVMPNIPENSTQEQINEILNTFETTMKAKQAKGEAKIARRKSDIGYKFERSSDMNQHIVNVYVNGRVRRFVCQGNPRAAQAINGLLRDSGTRNWATEKSAKLNRICAQLNTSLNPDFVSSNLMRDLTSASANLTKEGMGYTWDFCMEYAKNWGSMVRRKDGNFDGGYLGMFRRYKEGRLDTNNQKERWFKEFMDNGGETGFVSLKKYEDIIKEYENLVKTGNKDGDRWLMKKLKEGGALVELANEVVENVARYSTYCVSRKRGRSIGKSIYDAKEVSSNFNRHGSGDAIKSLKTEYDGKTNAKFRKSVGWFNSWMKNQTMFYNAGVQGANLFAKNLYNNTKTAAIAFGAMPFGLNIAVALLNQLLISQEDEKKRNGVKNPYAELPEWKRRNNLCIYWGGGNFKTIPMGIELRAFYGLGDIAAGYVVDESLKSDVQIGWDLIGQMAQIVPVSDFLGHHSPSSGIKELAEDVLLSATPTVAKPELELAFNRNWTGRPIYRDKDYLNRAPRWKRAYDSTNDVYMSINKWANKTFNGIDDTNEDLKGSGMIADAADFFTAPYGLQHIVEGYTGGTGATIGRTYQTGKSLVKSVVSGIKDDKGFKEGFKKEWKNVDPNSIPFYRVFNYTPKEGNDMQRTKSKWYNYVNELEQLKYNKRQMKTNTSDVVMNIHNAATKYKFSKTKEGKMLKIYEAADKYISAKNELLKRAKDQTVINSINEDINRKMQEAVADLDRIED